MKYAYLVFLVLLFTLSCVWAQASTVYKLTFDQGVQNPGPADYTAGANEILPTGVHGVLLSPDSVSGNLVDPDVPGIQGGQVLNMMRGATWPNKQGYFFGRDPVINGTNYGDNTYPAYTTALQTGDPGPVIVNEYTLEAVIRPDYEPSPWGRTETSVIYDSQRYDGITGGASLSVDQNSGILNYQSGAPAGFGGISSSFGLQAGAWYHIAVVVRTGALQQTELWINGVLDGTGAYPGTWETQGLFKLPGYFTIGTQYWPMSGRNWQGQIDAFAISDSALSPGGFVFGEVPEPGSMMVLGAGLAGLLGTLRRRRS